MPINIANLTPAVAKAKEIATLADLATHVASTTQELPVSNTADGLSQSESGTPIKGSTYTYTGGDKNVVYTYTASGWEQGGNPDALTPEDLGPTGTTVINGGRIDTDSLFARDVTYTGKITGGSGGLGGIIQSSNYVSSGGTQGMRIDLVNGSIYIA